MEFAKLCKEKRFGKVQQLKRYFLGKCRDRLKFDKKKVFEIFLEEDVGHFWCRENSDLGILGHCHVENVSEI